MCCRAGSKGVLRPQPARLTEGSFQSGLPGSSGSRPGLPGPSACSFLLFWLQVTLRRRCQVLFSKLGHPKLQFQRELRDAHDAHGPEFSWDKEGNTVTLLCPVVPHLLMCGGKFGNLFGQNRCSFSEVLRGDGLVGRFGYIR